MMTSEAEAYKAECFFKIEEFAAPFQTILVSPFCYLIFFMQFISCV